MARLEASERRLKILRAAITLFSEKGFEGTTTRELARRAGISEGLLFRHFPDKRRLYQAILSYKIDEQVPAIFEKISTHGTPREVLRTLAFGIATNIEKDPSFMRLLLFSALEGNELSDLFFQSRTLTLHRFLTDYLARQDHIGRLRVQNASLTARAFLALLFGFIQSRILFRIPEIVRRSREETLKLYVEIFLKGVER